MEKRITELAKEFQHRIWFGRHVGSPNVRKKDVNCCICGRNMTTREHEHPPFYCYNCDEEAESVHQ